MDAKHQLVTETVKFRWIIENYSTLKETRHYSYTFVAGGHKWRVIVYPKGKKAADFLSVFLDFVKMMPNGCMVPANINLTIVNQLAIDSSLKRRKYPFVFSTV